MSCLVLAALTLAGCASGQTARHADSTVSTTTGTTPAASPSQPASSPVTPSPGGGTTSSTSAERFSKVLVVVLENHSRSGALAGMPSLRARAERYGVATRSYGVAHPSLPNYLAIAGGSTFGVRDDGPPAAHPVAGPSVFGQVIAAGGTAKTYAEGMSQSCSTRPHGRYAVKHNPWAYFTDADERAACERFDVPSGTPDDGALHDDLAAGRLPTFSLLVPDMCHDAHDCSLASADAWLQPWLSAITDAPDFRAGRLLVVVTFDEDDYHSGNHILTVVLHPQLRQATISTRFDQYAVSALASRLVGAKPLRQAASAADLLPAVRSAMAPA
jgi:acid phosphatase